MYYHWSYFLLIAAGLLTTWASFQVQGTYRKYNEIRSSMGMTGAEVAQTILQRMGVDNVSVEPIGGELSDHYDPSAKAVRLSEVVYNSDSLAAAAVAAHECGHVLQDVQGYKFMNVRAAIFPVTQIGSQLGPILVMLGLGLTAISGLGTFILQIGIILFAVVVLFHIVTLPVEFDASRRALKLINDLGILQGEENQAARKVLNAAAFTYVAAALYAGLQLFQYIMILNSSKRE